MTNKEILYKGNKILKENNLPENISLDILYIVNSKIKNINDYYEHQFSKINAKDEEYFLKILNEYLKNTPLNFFSKTKNFYSRDFILKDNVFCPRYETEKIIDILKDNINLKEKINILDLCSGSGNIGLTAALEYKNSYVELVDIDNNAISNIQDNIKKFNIKNTKVTISNLFENINSKFDVILMNPPYIKRDDDYVDETAKKFDPEKSLFADNDGFDFYYQILEQSKNYLNKKNLIIFEIGYNQKEKLEEYLKDKDIKNFDFINDYFNKNRFLIIKNLYDV
jgi:release factor glutamine methyltransferase